MLNDVLGRREGGFHEPFISSSTRRRRGIPSHPFDHTVDEIRHLAQGGSGGLDLHGRCFESFAELLSVLSRTLLRGFVTGG